MLTERQFKIIELIAANPQGIFGSRIAEQLHVSDRTIRNEIVRINAFWKEKCTIESSNKSGYSIAPAHELFLQDFLYQSRQDTERAPENRMLIMLGILLFEPEVDYYLLGERLFLSTQSVQRETYNLQRMLAAINNNVRLVVEKERVHLVAEELELRNLILRIIKDEVQGKKTAGHAVLSDLLYKRYDRLEFKYLSLKVREHLEGQGVTLSSDNLVLIASAIYTCVVRNNLGCVMPYSEPPEMDSCAQALLEELKSSRLPIYSGDMTLLNGFLSTFQLSAAQHEEQEISPLSTAMLDEFCGEVLDKYGFDLKQSKDLYANMLLHIEYMIRRIKSGYEVVNPILNSVKMKYPYAYEISMLIVHIVYKHFGHYLRDDEISYMAVYLEHFIQNINHKLHCVVISSPQRSISHLLTKWLSTHFSNHLTLLDCIPAHQLDDFVAKNEVDLIISSEMGIHPKVATCMISSIPDEQDQAKLSEAIRKIRQNRRSQELIRKNFCAQAIKFYEQETSFEQVIADLSLQLQQQGKIADAQAFAEDVLQREVNYPTALCDTFMIPHPLFTFATKTAIAAAVLSKPISTAERSIQLVFLLAIEPAHNSEVGVLFGLFKQLANNKHAIKQLCETGTTDAFLDCLVNFFQSI